MAITDGMRTHDEGDVKRYRMPDLLTLEEMRIYFAGTYGVGIEIVELSDEMRERATGVGTLPVATVVGDRDRETIALRRQLGLEDNGDEVVKELHGRVMTRDEFSDKYGPQPDIAPPEEKPDMEAVGEGNTDEVEGPLPVVETEEERRNREETVDLPEEAPEKTPEEGTQENPGKELSRLLNKKNNK